jgi:peptide/nickel transport system substrate-binding protein
VQSTIQRNLTPDCRTDVRRSVFLPKQKSRPFAILRIVNPGTLTFEAFGVPS